MTKNAEVLDRAKNLFNGCAQAFETEEELFIFATTMVALGVALLRGTEGDEFVHDFLFAVMDEKNPLVIKPQKVKVN